MRFKRWHKWYPKLAAFGAAGILFQTAGCQVNNQELLGQLLTSIASVFLTGYVNDLLGVTTLTF